MAVPGICVLCLADTCTSEVHPVFNPVAPYGYLLSDMYLFMADITNPDFLVLGICLSTASESILNGTQNVKINRLYQCQSIFLLLCNHIVL